MYGVNGARVIQCNIRDITARKHAEKQVGEQVQQSQRMEAVGQLAGGLAHDFNNLLGVILGYCELLEHRLTPDGSNRRMVEQIHSAGTRAASLTRQLLAFSRRQVLRPLVLDLNRLVSGMETMLCRLIGENIEIATRLIPDLRCVKADPSQIEQILMNLGIVPWGMFIGACALRALGRLAIFRKAHQALAPARPSPEFHRYCGECCRECPR